MRKVMVVFECIESEAVDFDQAEVIILIPASNAGYQDFIGYMAAIAQALPVACGVLDKVERVGSATGEAAEVLRHLSVLLSGMAQAETALAAFFAASKAVGRKKMGKERLQ